MKSKSNILLIVVAAVLIELTSLSMYWFSSQGIREEVKHRAETELNVKSLEIQKVMTAVEARTSNSAWMVERTLSQPDSLYTVLRHLVTGSEDIVGAAVLFEADYYPQKGRWYEPYVVKRRGGIEEMQLGNADHDYLNRSWYRTAMAAGRGYWSDPYFDGEGAQTMLCTYLYPIRDGAGKTVALLGADVSLDWLSEVINADHIYPSSYNIIISRTGHLMACPVESLVLRKTIQEVTAKSRDTTAGYINRQMMEGQSGQAALTDEAGEKQYIFYAPVEGEQGWKMAVVCSDSEVYGSLRTLSFALLLLMIAGLALMSYIIWRSVRNARTLLNAESQKAALDKELHIASSIQQALLPKDFRQERQDVAVHAQLTPARQVGGDLYDYYIRNEKLFFCIGDVSGKGVPASLIMAVTRTLFRTMTAHEAQPHRIVTAINDTFSEDNPNCLFVTFFVGVLDLPTGRLRYCSAGHEAPLLIEGDKLSTLPCAPNIPLGAMAGWDFKTEERMLADDADLFLYTDGLTEAMNASEELFGKERVKNTLKPGTPNEIIDTMEAAVKVFVGDADQSDDLTLLAIEYKRQKCTNIIDDSITLPNDIETVPQLSAFVDKVCEQLHLDMSQTMKLQLAVEEAVVNVMNYAYPAGSRGEVRIDALATADWLKFVITDSGIAFDPTAKGDADTTLSAEERPIGGLGIHLVRHYMDSINYERVDGQNILTLRYNLNKK